MTAPAVAIPPPEAAAAHPLAWLVYASRGKFVPARHLRFIADRVMALNRGEIKRLAVSVPPRHGKSIFLAQHLPAWWLGTHPEHRVVYVTMQERFSRSWGRKARDDFFAHAEPLWGVTTWPRASTAEWDVFRDGRRTGGSMTSVGAGGTITGKGADLAVIDDLYRNMKEALNPNLRAEQYEWFQSAVLTRLEPGGRVIILMTRWHHDDLIGKLMKEQAEYEQDGGAPDDWEPWTFINLPAIAETSDPLGRQPGEALWPGRYNEKYFRRQARAVGPYVWEALYQGRPTPRSGNIFKLDWFRTYERHGNIITIPERGTCHVSELRCFGVADLATSRKKRADYTVVSAWGWHPKWGVLVLLGLERERLAGPAYVPAFRRMIETHKLPILYCEREGPLVRERLGFSVVKEAQREGLPVVEITPDGDKETRAYASTGSFAAGQVWFPEAARATWRPEVETELLTFPSGEHDDCVDVCTYAVGIWKEFSSRREPRPIDNGEEDERDPDPGWWNGSR